MRDRITLNQNRMCANMIPTTDAAKQSFVVTLNHQIKIDDLWNLLVSAIEGGSNYWIETADAIKPPKLEYQHDRDQVWRRYDYPFNPGGGLEIILFDDEQKSVLDPEGLASSKHVLNLERIKRGTEIMMTHKDHIQDWAAVVSENADAGTADVWLQLCLFGKVIYG